MLTPENVVVVALLGCLVLPWLLSFLMAPIRMRLRSWQSADPVYSPDDERRLLAGALKQLLQRPEIAVCRPEGI